ncbi:MAG: hypothetical protein ACI9SE_002057 [Neolewinella sp.]|jgi:uncharacterized protein (DUF433 family)
MLPRVLQGLRRQLAGSPLNRMKELLVLVATLLLAGSHSLLAQDDTIRLKVQPDRGNVLANSLVGSWVIDVELNQRLGNRGKQPSLQFAADASVLAGVPAPIAKQLRTSRIYLAGTMTMADKKHAFLVTEKSGNPIIVWFRERGGDSMGDTESWHASLARAEVAQADLLFLGGDRNSESFAAYERAGKPVGTLTPVAALAEMSRLLGGGEAHQFVTTYCTPKDLAEMVEAGRSIDRIVEHFRGPRGKQLVAVLAVASKSEPVMSEGGDVATWTLKMEGLPPRLSLLRIDGRWYLRNR